MTRLRPTALAASAILNVFLIAFLVGHVLQPRRSAEPHAMLVQAVARAERELSPEDAAVFQAVMLRDAGRYGRDQAAIGEARRALRRQIASAAFAPTAARQALTVWRAAWNNYFNDFGATFIEALSKVSPEGRHKLAGPRSLDR